MFALGLLALVGSARGFGFACSRDEQYRLNGTPNANSSSIPVNLKIALIGDNNKEVLEFVLAEGAEAVVHAGDFDYEDDPTLFEQQITSVLGPNFPYFATMGNHDVLAFNGRGGYQDNLHARLVRTGLANECNGDVGVDFTCSYKGVLLVGTAVGTCYAAGYDEEDHIRYVNTAMAQWGGAWKICHHHKNQRLYQTGTKTDETGYAILDTCRQHGAIMMTGHEHSYARTFEMSNFEDFEYTNIRNPTLRAQTPLQEATSFLFVSGLGGESVRGWDAGRQNNPWWAATASDDGCTGYCPVNRATDYGVLFAEFNYNGNRNQAHFYYKDIRGVVFDDFIVTTTLSDEPTGLADTSCAAPFVEFYVNDAADDAVMTSSHMGTASIEQAGRELVANQDQSILLTFRNVTLEAGAAMQGAWLQVFGAVKGEATTKITIRAMHQGKMTTAAADWTFDSEDWEMHTVWVSADLASVLGEVLARPTWTRGDDVVLILTVEDAAAAPRTFLSADAGFAPTLAVELVSPCAK